MKKAEAAWAKAQEIRFDPIRFVSIFVRGCYPNMTDASASLCSCTSTVIFEIGRDNFAALRFFHCLW